MASGSNDPEQALFSELNSALEAYRRASSRLEQALNNSLADGGSPETYPDPDIQYAHREYARTRDTYRAVLERWSEFVLTGAVKEKSRSASSNE